MELLFRTFCVVVFIAACYSHIVRRDNGCGAARHYTAPNGTIRSHAGFDAGHNYGKGLRCTWTIEAPVGWLVELVADEFEVEGSSTNCYRDYLTLYDGPGTNSSSLGKFCGTSFQPVTSSGRFLTLLFTTNTYTQMHGFKLQYNFTKTLVRSCRGTDYLCTNYRCVRQSYRCDGDDDCGDDSDEHNCPPFTCVQNRFPCIHEKKCIQTSWLCDGDNDCKDGSDEVTLNCHGGAWKCGVLNNTGSSGAIASPGFPTTYPNSLSCKYHIFAPNGTTGIMLKFDPTFHIETDVSCTYDYLTVYSDGLTFKHGPFCGDHAPTNFTIPSSHAIVEFNSDNSDGYAGFKVQWTALH